MIRSPPNAIRKSGPAPGLGALEKPVRRSLATLRVGALPGDPARGRVCVGSLVIRCALGPRGIRRDKREGDGATPAGSFRLEVALVRPDRVGRPETGVPVRWLRIADGWCDDPSSPLYNRAVQRPFAKSHEALWRADALYDCIVVLDHNRSRIRKGRGSAIFLHVATPGLQPTAGCVAVPRAALLRLLPRLGPRTRIVIG